MRLKRSDAALIYGSLANDFKTSGNENCACTTDRHHIDEDARITTKVLPVIDAF